MSTPGNWVRSIFASSRTLSIPQRQVLHVSQLAARHHFDSMRLALNVAEFGGTPAYQAEWLLRVAEAADKCDVAISECVRDPVVSADCGTQSA
jgi:hypothetical protein